MGNVNSIVSTAKDGLMDALYIFLGALATKMIYDQIKGMIPATGFNEEIYFLLTVLLRVFLLKEGILAKLGDGAIVGSGLGIANKYLGGIVGTA